MQRLEVSGAVRPLNVSLVFKGLNNYVQYNSTYPENGYPDPQLSGSAWPFGLL